MPFSKYMRELDPACLSLLEKLAAERAALPQVDGMARLPYRLAVANTFAEVPEPVRGLEGLFPFVEQAIVEDERFNDVFPVAERDAIGANISKWPSGQERLRVKKRGKDMESKRRKDVKSGDLSLSTRTTWPKVGAARNHLQGNLHYRFCELG